MSLTNVFVAGAYEHPTRFAPDRSTPQLHYDVAAGALADAGLSVSDVDMYCCAGNYAPGLGHISMAEYLGVKPAYGDSTNTGGSAYLFHLNNVYRSIAMGRCHVALITLAGRPKADGMKMVDTSFDGPDRAFEMPHRPVMLNLYGMAAKRHMYEFGTTSEQLAWIKVAASHHAQHNPHALLRKKFTVEDVLNSPMASDPLHRADSCVITDGGGAVVVVSEEVMRSLKRPRVKIRGVSQAIKHNDGGRMDITWSAGVRSGAAAFEEAKVTPADIKIVGIYDSFTITVLITLEDLGFCKKGEGGKFVADGNLISGVGKLPFNTDGGGLCSNHPVNRGSMTKIIECVRQLRGEAHPQVQVSNCDLALAHGTGGSIGSRHASATAIFERV
jgi:acetyl-CoA C-acetyltransferase